MLMGTCIQQAFAQHTILIRNINLVDVEKGIIRPHAAVLIRDSVILSISYTDTSPQPPGRYHYRWRQPLSHSRIMGHAYTYLE